MPKNSVPPDDNSQTDWSQDAPQADPVFQVASADPVQIKVLSELGVEAVDSETAPPQQVPGSLYVDPLNEPETQPSPVAAEAEAAALPIDVASVETEPAAVAPVSDIPQWNVGSDTGQNAGRRDLLTVLIELGRLTPEQAESVRFMHVQSGKSFEELLTTQQMVSEEDLVRAMAAVHNFPFVGIETAAISPEAMAFIPIQVAERYAVLPFDYDKENNRLSIAMADPMDLEAIEFIEKKTRTVLKPFAAVRSVLMKSIKDRYGVSLSSEVKQVLKETSLGENAAVQEAQITQMNGVIREAPITKIVTYILEYAIKTRASDVHIEPQEERTRIRYRIDGILQEKLVLPKKVHDALVSRIKIMSNLKIDEKRLPQDGRFAFKNTEQEVDLRVSTLPTVFGEKVVMRLLKKTGGAVTMAELGMRGRALKNLEEGIAKPHGIVLVTGPTGSGKTTTLYSVLTKLNTAKVNIMTLEDPVEYQIDGVNQVQVNPQIGLTFASGLRSFLRQDPNIIMVGEIRDKETAELAIQAALTGHLVLSTLHTNNASSAPPRLLDMEAEPFLLASTITAVVGQRVARKVCPTCRKEYDPPPEVVKDVKKVLGPLFPDTPIKMYKGEGCQECGTSGYLGRVGIYEVLSVTEKIGRMILERRPAVEMEHSAIEDGMITMKQDGYLKVLEGLTTIEEVLRVAET